MKEAISLANLTTKELTALEDQLNFERVLCCKYQDAARSCNEADLQSSFRQYATQHQQNYQTLLNFLH